MINMEEFTAISDAAKFYRFIVALGQDSLEKGETIAQYNERIRLIRDLLTAHLEEG